MSYKFTFGADPEVFVQDKDGQFVSGWGLVKGDKKNPYPVERGAVQVDGMALEFNIEPATSKREFSRNIKAVQRQLQELIGPNYALVPQSTVDFSEEIWANTPKEAKELGCDPDFNAWNEGRVNPAPNGDVKFRTGAGHIHIGWTNDMDPDDPVHKQACIQLTKQLDCSLGLWSVMMDQDKRRRQLYGSMGSFRPKPYGCEYRVLSNFWLKEPRLVEQAFEITKIATNDLYKGDAYYLRMFAPDLIVRNIFNNGTARDARSQLRNYFRNSHIGRAVGV